MRQPYAIPPPRPTARIWPVGDHVLVLRAFLRSLLSALELVVHFTTRCVFVAPRTIAARFLTARLFAVDRSVPGRTVMRRRLVMDRMVLVSGGATLSERDAARSRHGRYRQEGGDRNQTLDHEVSFRRFPASNRQATRSQIKAEA
jgi:hypothetical protein